VVGGAVEAVADALDEEEDEDEDEDDDEDVPWLALHAAAKMATATKAATDRVARLRL
jgi:hypothetical protein